MNTLTILRGTFGNFRPLSSITSARVNRFIQTYHHLEQALSWTPKCLCQIAFNVMNALAILRGTFGNIRPLSLTTSACVNLRINLQLLRTRHLEHLKAFTNACKHYKINNHSRNSSGVLLVTFDHYHWLLRLGQSSFKLTITSNARHGEHSKAFANV